MYPGHERDWQLTHRKQGQAGSKVRLMEDRYGSVETSSLRNLGLYKRSFEEWKIRISRTVDGRWFDFRFNIRRKTLAHHVSQAMFPNALEFWNKQPLLRASVTQSFEARYWEQSLLNLQQARFGKPRPRQHLGQKTRPIIGRPLFARYIRSFLHQSDHLRVSTKLTPHFCRRDSYLLNS